MSHYNYRKLERNTPFIIVLDSMMKHLEQKSKINTRNQARELTNSITPRDLHHSIEEIIEKLRMMDKLIKIKNNLITLFSKLSITKTT